MYRPRCRGRSAAQYILLHQFFFLLKKNTAVYSAGVSTDLMDQSPFRPDSVPAEWTLTQSEWPQSDHETQLGKPSDATDV
jgi:hypothetical protein